MIQPVANSEARTAATQKLRRPVVIVIPTYGAADKLAVCLRSLVEHAPLEASIHVVDDCTPGDSIGNVCQAQDSAGTRIQYVRRPQNRGFVETCNWAFENLRPLGADLLLLNSDTEVTEGFLSEMQSVLDLDEKHAAVCPRSNNATLFSIPPVGPRLEARQSYSLWKELQSDLPRFHVTPTAVGFCLLIKTTVLDFFGELFDTIYSPGYNEENDFICRINKFGYSAVSANWAFVFHYESSSFSDRRQALEERNRRVLDSRYPEYARKVQEYFDLYLDPVEYFAALRLPHRPRLLFDLSHIAAAYNGTSEYGLNLLRALREVQPSEYDLFVGIQPGPGADFFAREMRGYRLYDVTSPRQEVFDLVFKPSQFFQWREFVSFNRLAPRLVFTLQDIIGVRCEYLNSAYRRQLFLMAAELSDLIITISRYSQRDFSSYYASDLPMTVIHHGTFAGLIPASREAQDYVLVVGNSYAHKAVPEALEQLGDELKIMVLGGSDACAVRPNITRLPSGHISKQKLQALYAGAKAVIYPSHYEGYGLPVIDALALGKPVIAVNAEVNRELSAALADGNLHLVDSYRDLLPVIAKVTNSEKASPPRMVRSWSDVGKDYDATLRAAMAADWSVARLRHRWRLVADVSALGTPVASAGVAASTPPFRKRITGRLRREAGKIAIAIGIAKP